MDSEISSISLRYLMNIHNMQLNENVNQNCRESEIDISFSSENSSQSDDTLQNFLNEIEAEKKYINSIKEHTKLLGVLENMQLIQEAPENKQTLLVEQCNISIQCSLRDDTIISLSQPLDAETNALRESVEFFDQSLSPPTKRPKMIENEFFSLNTQQIVSIETEKFFNESEVNTLDLFDNECSAQSLKNLDEFKFSLTPLSQYSSDDEMETSFIEMENQGNENFSKEQPNFKVENEFSKHMKLENTTEVIETSVLDQEIVVDTSYYAPYITKTPTKIIEEFYKAQENIENEKKNNFDKFIEPSLEYLASKHNILPVFTVGDKNEKIVITEQDSEDYTDYGEDPCPNESLEAMMASFFIEKPTFVCSTPEKSYETENVVDNKVWSNLQFNKQQEMQFDANEQLEIYNQSMEKVENQNQILKDISYCSLIDVSKLVPVCNNSEFDITEIFDIQFNQEQVEEKINEPEQKTNECEQEPVQDKLQDLLILDSRINEDERYESMIELVNSLNDSKDKSIIIEQRKAAIMCHIENIFQTLNESLVEEKPLTIKFRKIKDWSDCTMEGDVLSQKMTVLAMRTLSFSNKTTQRTFTIVTHLLSEIYKMLAKNSSCTKRELYYRDAEFLKNQTSVNKAIEVISTILNVPAWELGVLSTSKGLIAGDIAIITEDEVIDCKTIKSVPQNPSEIKEIKSCAEYVLVVEKDTVFTKLIKEDFFEKSLKNCILVTAKGYPDVNTRVLLRKIINKMKIPVYIIVDADPYGIEIMCTYKYGSLELVNHSEQLALSKNIEWIGIHPSDIETLNIVYNDMTAADLKKVNDLMQRPYMNPQLERELVHMKNRKQKAEIESIYDYSVDYLIQDYIPRKISTISTLMETLTQEVSDAKEFSLNQ
ncbi:hypothetical protein PVAND_014217 [Polypedilum vanderplanki]|uniref:DNA topoisomerase (ATP-hydrolyzing) n=1 Tax=Polypedilum vanderplanki TaxID=319348 RepID=A0A9J6CTC4_POLVA|nr:hypothetical protein PVAND_014217 [Polypedilum vanderplanki]